MAKAKAKDEAIIAALLSNATVRAASAACGVSERVIYTRLKEPEFKARYDKARLELLEQHSNRLQQHIGSAIEEMAAIATDKENSAQVRLNASEAIIRTSLKLTEQVDILQRIEKLEEQTREQDNL